MGAAQVAPGYSFRKGRPVLLLISSRNERGMDGAFAEAKIAFGEHVRFIKLDLTSASGRNAAREFSVEKAPTVVLADSKGQVVEKIEGIISAADLREKLKNICGVKK